VEAVSKDTANDRPRRGAVVQTPLIRLAPDPLAATGDSSPPALQGGEWWQNC